MGIDWDQFKQKDKGEGGGGDFPPAFKFTQPGDEIAGTITAIRVAQFASPVPELYIKPPNDVERSVLAGQMILQQKLAEAAPAEGDHIHIKLVRIEPRQGGKTLKHFEVTHTPANGTPTTSQPASVGVAASELI